MTIDNSRRAFAGHAAMLAFSIIVAGAFPLGSPIANDLPPAVIQALRFACSVIVVGCLVALGPGFRGQDFRAPWRYLLTGAVFATYFVMMFEALKTSAPLSTSAVFTLAPAITALFGWFLMRQGVGRILAMALSVGAAGALWVIFRGDLAALMRFEVGRGEMIYFIGVIAHSLFVPLNQRLSRGEHVLVQTWGVLCGGMIVLMILAAPSMLATDWGAVPTRVYWVLAYLVLFATVCTFFFLQFASQRLPAAKVMAYTYLVPSWVIGWEIALGKGLPPAQVMIGIGLCIAATLMLLGRDDRSRERPARVPETARTRPD